MVIGEKKKKKVTLIFKVFHPMYHINCLCVVVDDDDDDDGCGGC
jgi:hypothetical protein